MPRKKKTRAPDEPIEPVKVVVVAREEGIEKDTLAETKPDDVPNIEAISMPWWRAIAVRAARTYMTALTGLLSTGLIGLDAGVLPNEFGAGLWLAAKMSLGPAVWSILLNSTEILTKLDQTRPGLRA